MRWFAAFSGWITAAALLGWVLGLVYFSQQVPETSQPLPVMPADAIVVLTGGAARVQEGLELMERGMAQHMLISGVGEGVTMPDLLKLHANPRTQKALEKLHAEGKVTLGYGALNTVGNAVETARWAQDKKVESLYLVTAYYHLPRASMELAHALPTVVQRPYPVFPPTVADPWQEQKLLLIEYHKYLLAFWRMMLTKPVVEAKHG